MGHLTWPLNPPNPKITKTKQEQHQKQSNSKTKNKAKNKQNLNKRKTKKRETKTPKPSKSKQTRISHPTKVQNLGEQAFLALVQLYQTHKKQTTITFKAKKRNKNTFCHVQKQPTIFRKFSVFSQHTAFYCNCCILLKTR